MRPVKQDVHEAFVWVGGAGQVVGVDRGFSDMFGWTMVRGGRGGRNGVSVCLREGRQGEGGALLTDRKARRQQVQLASRVCGVAVAAAYCNPASELPAFDPPCCRLICTVGARAGGTMLWGGADHDCDHPACSLITQMHAHVLALPLMTPNDTELPYACLARCRPAGGQHRRG